MTKKYDWAKLPVGIGAGAKDRICEYVSDGRYNYFPHTGAFSADAATPNDPDAAAEAYARLRAAAKACEVTWIDEWCEVTGAPTPADANVSIMSVEYDGLLVYGYCDGSRRYRTGATYYPQPTLQSLKRITETVEKLEALGWMAH